MALDPRHESALVFLVAFLSRLFGVVITSATELNPYSLVDADTFSRSANRYAASVLRGEMAPVDPYNIIEFWGVLLSPFWILPGPSRVYARLGMAVIGSLAALNVYLIARHYHSREAGVFAALPFVFFPSLVLVHSSVLRDTVVLFGLTTAARLLLVPPRRLPRRASFVLVLAVLTLTTMLRYSNLEVYVLVLLVVMGLRSDALMSWVRSHPVSTALGGLGVVLYTRPDIRYVVDYLARTRRLRAHGRTEYLGDVFPTTVLEAVAFSWVGAVYFLFSPFPWMIETGMDFVVFVEAVLTLGYAGFAVYGMRYMRPRTPAGTVGLVLGFVLLVGLYGLGTANVGTAVRHRQMVTWVLFLLGGFGIAMNVRFRSSRSWLD